MATPTHLVGGGVRVTVYDSAIVALFKRGGDVSGMANSYAREALRIAKNFTPGKLPPDPRPWKSENLRESNRFRGYLQAGPTTLGQIVLENTASYALYAWRRGPVHAPIGALQVPRVHVGGGAGFVYLRDVRAHRDPGPHWLEAAARVAARTV